jgi:hypothetical protein
MLSIAISLGSLASVILLVLVIRAGF